MQHSADNSAQTNSTQRVGDDQLPNVSPVAPRFLRETARGAKRQFQLSKFDDNLAKKQMVHLL
jgi:hypothetical protein